MNELRLNDWFDVDPMEGVFRNMWKPWRQELAERAPQIRLDLKEQGEAYTVKAEIPGVRKEDIDVRVDGNQVTVSAEVKKDKEETKEGRVLRSERLYGFASRAFALPTEVDAARVEARYQDGVLELKLPKKTTTPTKRIAIT